MNTTNKAVIVEEDYKGDYSRYALTLDEFRTNFQVLDPDIPDATEQGNSYTLRPLVHIWYKIVEIDSEYWNEFFTDMYFELPESDIENENPAYIATHECISLRPLVEKYVTQKRSKT